MSDKQDLPTYQLYIDGAWRPGHAGVYDLVYNPATNEAIAYAARADEIDTRAAIQAARTAFDDCPWPCLEPGHRQRILHEIVDALEAHQDELVELEIANGGCTWRKASFLDVPVGLIHFRHFARLAEYESIQPVPPITFPALSYNYVRREPIGVCGQIIPWNFPFLMAVWKIAPALAAGNTVILKPASHTPSSAVRMVKIIHETGLLPPGVLNLVTGPGSVVGRELCTNPQVDKIAYTGSTAVGREIMRQCASTIKKVTLELGGKSPNLLLEDADLDVAVDGSLWGVFLHAGQACESGSRVFVPASRYDEFMERLLARARCLRIGLPDDPETDIGPLISVAQLRRIERYVELGLEEEATPALLGSRPRDPKLARGHFYTPTIFTDVRNDMRIAQEEIFGPVLCVIKYDSLEEAIRQANGTIYGLAAGVWSRDVQRALSVANSLKAGTVWINDFHVISAEAPFGGYKQSGLGRELGTWGLLEYTEIKHVHVDLSGTREAKYWYNIVVPRRDEMSDG